jgi:ribosomal protein S6--L-glutamate ligase
VKIALLSQNASSYFHERITQAAKMRHHQVRVLRLPYCYMNISATTPKVFHRDTSVEEVDVIIPRIEPEHILYGASVLRQFEMMGVKLLNSPIAILWSRDKLRVYQWLSRKKVPLPVTGFADSPQETEKLVHLVGGAPLVVKLLEGTEGRGTIFAETHQAAVSVINAFKQLKAHILVQEYVADSKGHDIRCLVIANKVVTAIQRSMKNTECCPIKITAEERRIAVQATTALKLNMASVDLIRSERGPLFVDINANPDLELLEKVTHQDMAGHILDCLEEMLPLTGPSNN